MEKKKMKSHRHIKPVKKNQVFPTWAWISLAAVALVVLAVLALTRPQQQAATNSGSQAQAEALPLTVTVSEAAQMRTEGAYILDVREPLEWEELRIPEANLIPLGQLESRFDQVPKDQEILVVCRSGNRSATGRDILLAAGFPKVTSMDGGMLDWYAQGFATISSN